MVPTKIAECAMQQQYYPSNDTWYWKQENSTVLSCEGSPNAYPAPPSSVNPITPMTSSSALSRVVRDPYPYSYCPSHGSPCVNESFPFPSVRITGSVAPPGLHTGEVDADLLSKSVEPTNTRNPHPIDVDLSPQEEELWRAKCLACAKDMEAIEAHLLDTLHHALHLDMENGTRDTISISCTRCGIETVEEEREQDSSISRDGTAPSLQEEARMAMGFESLDCPSSVSLLSDLNYPPNPVIATLSFRSSAIRFFVRHYEALNRELLEIEHRLQSLRQYLYVTPESSMSATSIVGAGPFHGTRMKNLREEVSAFLLHEILPTPDPPSHSTNDSASHDGLLIHPSLLFSISLPHSPLQSADATSSRVKSERSESVFCSAARYALLRILKEISEEISKVLLNAQKILFSLPPDSISGQPAYGVIIPAAKQVLEELSVTVQGHINHLECLVLQQHRERQSLKECVEASLLPLLTKDVGSSHLPDIHWCLPPTSIELRKLLCRISGIAVEEGRRSYSRSATIDTDLHVFNPAYYPLPPCPDAPVMVPQRLSRYHTQKSPPRHSAAIHNSSSSDENEVPNRRSKGGLLKWFHWMTRKRQRDEDERKVSSSSRPRQLGKDRCKKDNTKRKKMRPSQRKRKRKEVDSDLLSRNKESSPLTLFDGRKDSNESTLENICPIEVERSSSSSCQSSCKKFIPSTEEIADEKGEDLYLCEEHKNKTHDTKITHAAPSALSKTDLFSEGEQTEFGIRAGTSIWRAIPALLRSVKDRAISFSDSDSTDEN